MPSGTRFDWAGGARPGLFAACMLGVVLWVPGAAHGLIIPIDLNDFFADPKVTVSADGMSADFEEDPTVAPVIMSNDPTPVLGDPEVIVAGPGVSLVFDFMFVEGVTDPTSGLVEDDEFVAFIIDPATGNSLADRPDPSFAAFEFSTTDTQSGTVSFDLSELTSEPFLGLEFQLDSLATDTGFQSTLKISNVRLEVIPEPHTLGLVGFSAFALMIRRRLSL